ncbi:MAG TPA: SNF2-related protein, partial [Bradyrhizobium sp.]
MDDGPSILESARVLANVVKRKDLYNYFTRSAFEKGHAYQLQARVSGLEISDDLTRVEADVEGSEVDDYAVDIQLKFKDAQLVGLRGNCSCPMALNCKHVVATLLEAMSEKRPSAEPGSPHREAEVSPRSAPSGRPPGVLPYEINNWLEKLGSAIRGDDYPPELNQRLLYCLHPSDERAPMPVLAISLLSVRILKNGDFSANYTQPQVVDFSPDRAAKYYRDSDLDILSQLHARARGQYFGAVPQSAGLLQMIVATGRAFWLDHKRAPLRWGEKREGRIEWRQVGTRAVAPHLIVPDVVALNAEPPVYVDESAGTIGPVALDMPPRLAGQLLSAPAIPRTELDEVSRQLGRRLPVRHHDLLPSRPAQATKIDAPPVPVLRLMPGKESAGAFYYRSREQKSEPLGVAQLHFRYGPVEVESTKRGARLEVFHAGQVYEIARRQPKEKQARKRLADLGFVAARSQFPYLDYRHDGDLTLAAPNDWFDFLSQDVVELHAEGFEIIVDDNFPFRLARTSGDFDAEFESSGIDWFELALGIDIDGERHDLAPLVAALVSTPDFTPDAIRELAEAGGSFFLPLADGRYLALAANRFLPLVLALHSLRLSGLDASGKIRLSRADLVPLLGLENEYFVFRGADNIRRLAGLLQTRGLAPPNLPDSFRAELRPYQAQGIAWLDLLRESGLGGVLADDMGLGKTVQLLALLVLEKTRGNLAQPALIVAPTSLMTNWFNEAQRFAPDLKVLVLHGPDRKQNFAAISEYDVILTTYPLIARDREVLLSREWHIAVLDEAQTVKNPDAATTRWLRDVKARHRFCLTGTPMENHLGELWSILSFANPGYLGDKATFARHWRTPIEKRADKMRSAALAQRVKPFLLRRTKAEVATELPAKTEIIEAIVIEGAQRDVYDSIRLSMSRKVRKAIEERGLAKSHIVVLEALLRMRQAC